jgi:hypothetical protein
MAPGFGQELALASYGCTCILSIQINCAELVNDFACIEMYGKSSLG